DARQVCAEAQEVRLLCLLLHQFDFNVRSQRLELRLFGEFDTHDSFPFACVHWDPNRAMPTKTNARPHWVKPELVCEVAFTEWTEDGHLRHPIFQGLPEDVPASH